MRNRLGAGGLVLMIALAGLAVADLERAQTRTLVVYTTAALSQALEKDIIPRFTRQTGIPVATVYVAAGEEYNRLRLSGTSPEADVFLHASPMLIEQGYAEGYFSAYDIPAADQGNASFRSRDVDGGHVWYAFAWSPLAEVYRQGSVAPDLASSTQTFGFAHPRLSNNGVYAVIYFESLSPDAGRLALSRTSIQPTNGQANIGGLADGSFDVTLGYEAVTLQYAAKGAKVQQSLPLLDGKRALEPVVFSAGLVRAHAHPGAMEFIQFLFSNETQARLAKNYLRPVLGNASSAAPQGAIDISVADENVTYDWGRWQALQDALPRYEVKT